MLAGGVLAGLAAIFVFRWLPSAPSATPVAPMAMPAKVPAAVSAAESSATVPPVAVSVPVPTRKPAAAQPSAGARATVEALPPDAAPDAAIPPANGSLLEEPLLPPEGVVGPALGASAVIPRTPALVVRAKPRRDRVPGAAAVSGPRDRCSDRLFLTRLICMKRECDNDARLRHHPECLSLQRAEQERRDRLLER